MSYMWGRDADLALIGDDVGFGKKGWTVFGANHERFTESKQKRDPKNVFSEGHLLAPQFDAWHGGVPVAK